MKFIRSLLFIIFQTLSTAFFGLMCLILLPFPFELYYKNCATWTRSILWAARFFLNLSFEVKNPQNLPSSASIIYCKHQSTYETLIFPWHMLKFKPCFVYKKELHYIPAFGWGIANLRMIPINRKDGRNSMQQVVDLGTTRLKEGRLVVLFPEGTRTPVGKAGRYKLGAAHLASNSGFPIIPIAINSGEFWPKGRFIKEPGVITFSVGEPIDPTGLTVDEINKKASQWIENEMRVISPHLYKD